MHYIAFLIIFNRPGTGEFYVGTGPSIPSCSYATESRVQSPEYAPPALTAMYFSVGFTQQLYSSMILKYPITVASQNKKKSQDARTRDNRSHHRSHYFTGRLVFSAYCVRRCKLNSQFIVTRFSILHAGGRSLFRFHISPTATFSMIARDKKLTRLCSPAFGDLRRS